MATRRTPRKPNPTRKPSNPFDVIPGIHVEEYALPFVLFCGVIPLFGAGAWLWCQRAGTAQVLVPAALVLFAGIGGFAMWHESKARSIHNRARAAATVAWLCLQPAVTIVVGPGSYAWATTWLLVGFALGVWFIFRKQEIVRGDGSDAREQDDPFAQKVGLHASTQAKVVEDSPTRMKLRVTHEWDPSKNVAAAFETIARLKHLPAAGIRVIPTDDSAVSEVELMKVDMLKHATAWPGASAVGESVAAPAKVGTMQDGTPMEIVRPGDPERARAAIHTITMGMSGAGKTRFMMNEVAEMVTRRDVVIWLSDTSKSAQTTKPYLRPAVDWLVTTPAQTKMMVQAIDRMISKRADLLGSIDLEEWTPEAFEILGMPYLYVGFQEASRILTDDSGETAIVRIGEAARSAGISLDFSLQRASHSNMPTDLRSVLGSAVCFGVKEDVDASMVLSPDTIDAGARPDAWRISKPGACYIEASHVDPTRWSMPGRTYNIDRLELREHVAQWAPKMARLDKATAEAAGQPYAEREVVTVEDWLKTVRAPKRLIALGGGKPSTPNGSPNGTRTATPNTEPPAQTVAVLDRPEHPNAGPNEPPSDWAPNDADGTPSDDATEPTPEEFEQMAADDANDMTALLDELREGDPDFGPEDLAEFMAVDPREEFDPDSAPDVDFGSSPAAIGEPLTYAQKCAAFRDICELLFRAAGNPAALDTTTEQMVDEWEEVPGIKVKAPGEEGDPRPSLSRLLRKAEAAGMLEDRGRGKWRLLREIRSWDPTQRVLGDVDDESDGESPAGMDDDVA